MGLGLPLDVSACCHVFFGGHLTETLWPQCEALKVLMRLAGFRARFFFAVIESEKSQELIT